jgi:hypothetical protein
MKLFIKESSEGRRITMRYKLIASIVLVGMAILFIMQNVTAVEMTFLFWTLTMSRALWSHVTADHTPFLPVRRHPLFLKCPLWI